MNVFSRHNTCHAVNREREREREFTRNGHDSSASLHIIADIVDIHTTCLRLLETPRSKFLQHDGEGQRISTQSEHTSFTHLPRRELQDTSTRITCPHIVERHHKGPKYIPAPRQAPKFTAYRDVDKPLARPERTVTEDFDFHISYL